MKFFNVQNAHLHATLFMLGCAILWCIITMNIHPPERQHDSTDVIPLPQLASAELEYAQFTPGWFKSKLPTTAERLVEVCAKQVIYVSTDGDLILLRCADPRPKKAEVWMSAKLYLLPRPAPAFHKWELEMANGKGVYHNLVPNDAYNIYWGVVIIGLLLSIVLMTAGIGLKAYVDRHRIFRLFKAA